MEKRTQQEARATAKAIAAGHAFDKHVIRKMEFGRLLTRDEFALLIDNAIVNCTESRELARGRLAFWYQPEKLLVVVDPNSADRGTAYIPVKGITEFWDLN